MITKTLTYEDLDGNSLTDDFSFHLSKASMVRLSLRYNDDLEGYFKRLVESSDVEKIYEIIEEVIRMSVGKRGEDGKSFLRPAELVDGFMNSDAFSSLLMELLSDEGLDPVTFFKGVLPASMAKGVEKQQSDTKDPTQMSREELITMWRDREQAAK